MSKKTKTARLALILTLALLLTTIAQAPSPVRSSATELTQYFVHLPVVMVSHAAVPSVFGVRMQHVSHAFGLTEAIEASVPTVRSVTFSWKLIEPVRTSPPTYVWTSVDWLGLENAAHNGLELLATIHATPTWAQARPGYSCGPIKADQLDAFAQFLQALVNRFGGHPYHVHRWSVWNEPDVDWRLVNPDSGYGCWGDADQPDYGGGVYAQMLQAAYPAIKSAAPDAEVIAGGLLLNDPVSPSSRFVEGILQGGGGPYFDALGFHVYTYYLGSLGKMGNSNWPGSVTAIPEKAAFLQSLLDQYGFQHKALVTTEASLLVISGNPSPDSLETQAMYVGRAYAEALSLGLEDLIYYSMTDDWAGRNNGLLRANLSKKPSYYGYKTAVSFLSQASYLAPAAGYPAGVEGYAFALPNAQRTDVIWSIDGTPQTVTLPVGAAAYDRYGVGLGSGTVEVGYSPVYVVRH